LNLNLTLIAGCRSPLSSKGAALDFLSFGLKRPPTLRRLIMGKAFFGALKRSFPRMNAGAPSERQSREKQAGVRIAQGPARNQDGQNRAEECGHDPGEGESGVDKVRSHGPREFFQGTWREL
jgi:hypothetical protein